MFFVFRHHAQKFFQVVDGLPDGGDGFRRLVAIRLVAAQLDARSRRFAQVNFRSILQIFMATYLQLWLCAFVVTYC